MENRSETEIYLEPDKSEPKTKTIECHGFEDFLNKMTTIKDWAQKQQLEREQDMRKWTKNLYQDMEDYDRMTVCAKTLGDIAKVKTLILSRGKAIKKTVGIDKDELEQQMASLIERLETKKEWLSTQVESPTKKPKGTFESMFNCSDDMKQYITDSICPLLSQSDLKGVAKLIEAIQEAGIVIGTTSLRRIVFALHTEYAKVGGYLSSADTLYRGVSEQHGQHRNISNSYSEIIKELQG